MNKIDEMIRELCPEGVKRVKLGEVCKSICTGLNPRQNFILNEPGATNYYVTVKEIASNSLVFSENTDKITTEAYEIIQKRSHLEIGDILFSGIGTIGKVVYVDVPTENWNCSESVFLIKPNDCIYGKFLSYVLKSDMVVKQYESCASGAIMKGVRKATLESLEIPLPPLAIQQEIVSILDSFSSLQSKLEEELAVRQKQMEFYREKLLTFDKDDNSVKWMKLGEVGTMTKGVGILKSDFVESGFPCIHYGQVHTFYNTSTSTTKSFISLEYAKKVRKAKKGDLIIATTSEDVEACCKAVVWLGDGEVAFSGDSHCFSHNQNPKYMSYLFQTEQFAKQKRMSSSGAKVVRVSGDSMLKFEFPFPPLSRQQEIVLTLDTMSSLIDKLKEEIELRKKQYEYYREALLSF